MLRLGSGFSGRNCRGACACQPHAIRMKEKALQIIPVDTEGARRALPLAGDQWTPPIHPWRHHGR
jgi:hypothetical protein